MSAIGGKAEMERNHGHGRESTTKHNTLGSTLASTKLNHEPNWLKPTWQICCLQHGAAPTNPALTGRRRRRRGTCAAWRWSTRAPMIPRANGYAATPRPQACPVSAEEVARAHTHTPVYRDVVQVCIHAHTRTHSPNEPRRVGLTGDGLPTSARITAHESPCHVWDNWLFSGGWPPRAIANAQLLPHSTCAHCAEVGAVSGPPGAATEPKREALRPKPCWFATRC